DWVLAAGRWAARRWTSPRCLSGGPALVAWSARALCPPVGCRWARPPGFSPPPPPVGLPLPEMMFRPHVWDVFPTVLSEEFSINSPVPLPTGLTARQSIPMKLPRTELWADPLRMATPLPSLPETTWMSAQCPGPILSHELPLTWIP